MKEIIIDAIGAMNQCDRDSFPNIFYFIKILSMLSVTICNPEKTLLTLKK